MRTLIIETATPVLSVALFDDHVLLAHDHRHLLRGHAEALLPAIAALPDGGKANRIMVSCGPGSFTGIRVGVAAAHALAFAWIAELAGYDTLALIALGADLPPETPVAVAIPGGHSELFVAELSFASASLALEDAAAQLKSTHVVGAKAADLVAARGYGTAHLAEADARNALRLGPDAFYREATPAYGRAPDAKLPA